MESVAMAGHGSREEDVAGFESFVAARSTRLLRTAYLLTRDHQKAEDLLQTALAKTWLAWARIDEPEPYVRKVLVNTYSTWWQRRWRDERPTDDLPEQPYDSVGEVGRDLWVALGHLPRGQRAVLVLRYFEDLTEVETARLLDCSVGTVKSQSARGLARLRQDLALTEEAPWAPGPGAQGGGGR